MKEETKNEIDLLLRRFGRRDDATVPKTDHLDADELSAYAENALPAAARARYTSHLVECSRCRELVVQLSSAVGVVASTETANVSKPSPWRTFLASLFTPMVLRYAAPALGIIVVAAIGFVVLRGDLAGRRGRASNSEQAQAARAAAEPAPTIHDSITTANSTSSPQDSIKEQTVKKQSPASPAPPNAAPVVSSVNADVQADKAAQPKPEEQKAAANEPAPAKSEPTATAEVSQKPADAEATKKEARGFYTVEPTRERQLEAANKDEDKSNYQRAPRAADRVTTMAGAASASKLKRDELSSSTRSVAGRRFQKKGGVWIDTEYDSSKDVVSLARDSEQYRALVADEPSIKTIADELEGEIIVVWKGHTYRIH